MSVIFRICVLDFVEDIQKVSYYMNDKERGSKREISGVFMANATHNNGSYDL